jgi:NAD(P)-dependent dehydrogenase (short-subunit alcohol dehydrogenase family)
MDVETRPFGVRVSSILPAQFRTSMGANRLRGEPSDAYRALATHLMNGFQERAAAALTDLSPVVEAALHAATSETPRSRYVVGAGSASMLDAIMPELDALKAIEDARAGHD